MYFSMWNKWLLYYTNRSGYCKRQRPSLRNKYRTWKYTYRYYRTVNYCLFCYFVFLDSYNTRHNIHIPTETVQQWQTVLLTFFSRRSPEIKETFKQSPCRTQHNDSWFLIEHLQDLLLHIFVFFFLHYNIAKRSCNKLHTGTGLSNETKTLGICT